MADNLTVQISADSSKLRAEMALAQSRVREFGREVKRAADEARQTRDTSRLREVSAQYEAATRQARGLTRALSDQNKTVVATSSAWAGLAGNVRGAIGALAGVAAVRKLGQAFDDTTKKIQDTFNTAKGTGFDPKTIQVFEEVLGDAGVSADNARQALARFAEQSAQAQEQAGMFAAKIGDGVRVMRGGERAIEGLGKAAAKAGDTFIFRGDKKEVIDKGGEIVDQAKKIGDAFAALKIRTKDYLQTPEGEAQKLKDVAAALAQVNKEQPARATQLGRDIFGRSFPEMAAGIFKIGEAWAETKAQMQATGRLLTPEDEAALDRYRGAWDRLSDAVDAARMTAWRSSIDNTTAGVNLAGAAMELAAQKTGAWATAILQSRDAGLAALQEGGFLGMLQQQVGEILPGIQAAWSGLTAFMLAEWSKFIVDWQALNNGLVSGMASLGQSIREQLGGALDWVIEKAGQAWSAMNQASGSAGGALSLVPGMASGGLIRGGGSGTSDSILARLSNGEFVMRAGAVQHWGAGLLSAMNTAGLPRFAEGGLVGAAGGGTPVHLHLGGQSFALSGGADVVSSLVHEARRSQMRSAGVKPSWYGGTPGGR